MSTITLAGVILPYDLEWNDRYRWSEIAQKQDFAAQGELIVQSARRQAGRPIKLTGSQKQGWETRAGVETLRAMANASDDPMELYINTLGFNVLWDRVNGEIEETPLVPTAAPYQFESEWFYLTLRFIVLSEIE